MNEETQDKIIRYRDLKKIKTEEEYRDALKRLEYYKKEYIWMKETENPIKEVRKELEVLRPMYNGKRTAEQDEQKKQEYFLRCINLLTVKGTQIEKGEYLPNLQRNIRALLVLTKEYEQRQKNYKLSDIIKGIMQRDEKILEALRVDNLFERAFLFGDIPAEKDLTLQEPGYLVEHIGKHAGLVGIKVPEYKQNLSLVPVSPEGRITPEQEFVSKMLTEYLEENRQHTPHIPKHGAYNRRKTENEKDISAEQNVHTSSVAEKSDFQNSEKLKKEKNDEEGEINQ